ncbi:SigE family RNA polymerase sigma factor [Streptomyces sp. NPDC056361]|uniref:SigE family RNA polymerase sigma factor n=1 Tax=Streptomyces sp. NPDC056361 TaxID=3345795 RepID=UPI0035D6F65D
METLEEFLSAHLPELGRFTGAMTGDPHLAEDILSDALVVVVSRWRRISRTEHPLAYVRKIVVNTYLSDRRKAARRRTEPVREAAVLDRPVPDGGDDLVRRDQVARLLAALPPRQRAAVCLHYLYDMDDRQIADLIGCTPATVRSHLSQARAAMRLAPTTDRS